MLSFDHLHDETKPNHVHANLNNHFVIVIVPTVYLGALVIGIDPIISVAILSRLCAMIGPSTTSAIDSCTFACVLITSDNRRTKTVALMIYFSLGDRVLF